MKRLVKGIFGRTEAINPTPDPDSIGEPVEVSKRAIKCELYDSWKDPSVPLKQYETCTRGELEKYRKGEPIEAYDVLVDVLKSMDVGLDKKTILEIGCSTGYYSQVLKLRGINAEYHGCDYSESFVKFAQRLFPGIDFQVQDACSLTYPDNFFDIVISGCCLLHIMDFEKAIGETVRVAKDYVIFHRTPVLHRKETSYYIKKAYGVEMFEIHFNEREFLRLFRENHLKVLNIITFSIGFEETTKDFFAYKTYLCEKS